MSSKRGHLQSDLVELILQVRVGCKLKKPPHGIFPAAHCRLVQGSIPKIANHVDSCAVGNKHLNVYYGPSPRSEMKKRVIHSPRLTRIDHVDAEKLGMGPIFFYYCSQLRVYGHLLFRFVLRR
jgi:hypothetical protein